MKRNFLVLVAAVLVLAQGARATSSVANDAQSAAEAAKAEARAAIEQQIAAAVDAFHPLPETVQPASVAPPATTSQPGPTVPPATTTLLASSAPPATTSQPASTLPPVTSTPATTTAPPVTSTQPATTQAAPTSTQPAATSTVPPATSTRPAPSTTQPPATSTQPATTKPPATSITPPTTCPPGSRLVNRVCVLTCDPALTPVNPCLGGGYPAGSSNIDYTNATPGDVTCEPDIDGIYYYITYTHSTKVTCPNGDSDCAGSIGGSVCSTNNKTYCHQGAALSLCPVPAVPGK